jgi:hypothetical protein
MLGGEWVPFLPDPSASSPTPPQRPTKDVLAQPQTVEAIPWWQSVQMRWSIGVVAASSVGILHKLCTVFHFCILQKMEVSDATFLLFNLVTLVGGLYWVLKRVKVGNDPTNTSAPITLK